MKEYTLKSVRPLGDNDPKFGQTFWAESHDQAEPLMFNLVGQNVGEGARISAEIVELKTSGKGTQYHRLKKVKVLGSQQPTQQPVNPTAAVPADSAKLLQLVYDNTEKILKLVDKSPNSSPTLSETWKNTTQPDTVVEDIGDEPINLDDIPF